MSAQPRTLLEMAGVKPAPPPLATAALVFIDCQREYVDGGLALPGAGPALAEAQRVLQAFRAAGRPVIHIRHKGRAGGLFDPAKPAFQIDEHVAPEAGETVIEKALPNAFAGTGLADKLKALGARNLMVAGFMTHMCVSSTVRAALDLGLGCTVIADACATRDLPDGRGGVIKAAELHRAELAALADRFAVVVPNAAALAA